jgi:hypothetical protein
MQKRSNNPNSLLNTILLSYGDLFLLPSFHSLNPHLAHSSPSTVPDSPLCDSMSTVVLNSWHLAGELHSKPVYRLTGRKKGMILVLIETPYHSITIADHYRFVSMGTLPRLVDVNAVGVVFSVRVRWPWRWIILDPSTPRHYLTRIRCALIRSRWNISADLYTFVVPKYFARS